jgi:predicted secreted protein
VLVLLRDFHQIEFKKKKCSHIAKRSFRQTAVRVLHQDGSQRIKIAFNIKYKSTPTIYKSCGEIMAQQVTELQFRTNDICVIWQALYRNILL